MKKKNGKKAAATQVQTHQMGATVTPKGVSFRVWAPHAQSVFVTGDFNDWKPYETSMIPEDGGCWAVHVDTAKPGHEYKYVIVNGEQHLYRNDPYARAVTHSVGNSVVYDTSAFEWANDDAFVMPPHNELVIYEMHVGTFHKKKDASTGTFLTAIERLDWLKWLGINAVEVMPPFEFAGDLSWGYNPAHPFAIETAYGGPDAFKTFVKACHKRGIAVILDVVYNHFGPSDLDLWQFDGWSENGKGGIYFYNDWRSETPWGDTRPDYGRPEVRRYLIENALMWLSEYRCDGLRMDMVPYIRNVHADGNAGNDLEAGYNVIREMNEAVQHHFPNKITIAEDMHTMPQITDGVENGGFGYSAQWDAQFVHPMQGILKAADDEHRDMLALERALHFRYGNDVFNRIIYTESHDEVANGKARIVEDIAPGQNGNNYYAEKRALLGLATVLTAPGIPMLFQGQAILEDSWFQDTDPIDWYKAKDNHKFALSVRDLIRLRLNLGNNSKGLTSQYSDTLFLDNEDKVVAFHRYENVHGEAAGSVVVVMNFKHTAYEQYRILFPEAGRWKLLFDSSWEGYSDYNDDIDAIHTVAASTSEGMAGEVNIPAYGVLIYARAQNS
ncbi:MAG TPA: alpha-amylase family glycosyl hydrolase [Saprospiraceae bacterium]|nr:alpha-amylase family glycosyl hydrolase [Saprospiraceae bacterium]